MEEYQMRDDGTIIVIDSSDGELSTFICHPEDPDYAEVLEEFKEFERTFPSLIPR